MNHVDFDVAVLRSFVAGMDLGSFAKAADRVGRSTSAISAQIRKLEEQANTALFRKAGRGLALTDAGETLLAYARRLIELNDEATVAVRGVELEGWVRLGMQEDFGESVLPEVLGRFARAHPKVRIEARVARNLELLRCIESGQLDLALVWGDASLIEHNARGFSSELIANPAMCWIGSSSAQWAPAADEPLPLVAFDGPCLFHRAATAALDRAGIPWRVAFTSTSLSGLWAAAAAGLGVTVRTQYGLPPTVRVIDFAALNVAPLPSLPLALQRSNAKATPPVDRLATIVFESLRSYAFSWERAA